MDKLDKIKELINEQDFVCIWEVIEYLLICGYSEIESIMIGLEIFEGDVWNNVISIDVKRPNNISWSGSTITLRIAGTDPIYDDEIDVMIHILTKEGKPIYIPLYRAYLMSNKYNNEPLIENHIKTINITFKTDLGIGFVCNNSVNKCK